MDEFWFKKQFFYFSLSISFFSSDFLLSDTGGLGFFPRNISAKRPANTSVVPNHCLLVRTFPKSITENRTVKNFLVVVTIEQGNGPKWATIMKMKSCPRPPARAREAKCSTSSGCLAAKFAKRRNSPVTRRATPTSTELQAFIDNIMYWAEGALAALIRS